MTSLDQASFGVIAEVIKSSCGITVTAEKMYLVENRMQSVLRRYNFAGFSELSAALRKMKERGETIVLKPNHLIYDVVEAITVNETSFFRDTKPFNFLRNEIFPALKARGGAARIWSAACSTGQEPYSIALTALEAKAAGGIGQVDIVATDISNATVERARRGEYSQFEVQRGMPIQMLMKNFKQDGDRWVINDELKQMISFELINLTHDFSRLGKFDVVFCRNVLIYFEPATKIDILTRISKILKPDGHLILGGSETNSGVQDIFTHVEGCGGILKLKQ